MACLVMIRIRVCNGGHVMSKSGKCAYNFTVSSHKYDYFNIIIRFNFLIHADFSNMKIHVVSMHELSKP